MTVKELIEYLSRENPDMEVVVCGYEGGFDPINTIYKKFVKEDPDAKWYYGRYDETQQLGGKTVLVLPR